MSTPQIVLETSNLVVQNANFVVDNGYLFYGDGGGLSNVSGGGTSNLHQVLTEDNATTLDITTTGTVTGGSLVVNTPKGTSTVSSGTLTVDQDSKSYKISNISTSGTISALTWSNLVSGAQHAVTLEAYGGDITLSNSLGTGIKTSYNTTTISSGDCGVVTLYYDEVSTFVNCVTYPS